MNELKDWPKLTLDDFRYFQNVMLRYNMRRAYIRYNESIKSYQVFDSRVEDSAYIFLDDVNDVINKSIKSKEQ
jgi:hypothetical protein